MIKDELESSVARPGSGGGRRPHRRPWARVTLASRVSHEARRWPAVVRASVRGGHEVFSSSSLFLGDSLIREPGSASGGFRKGLDAQDRKSTRLNSSH